MYILLNGLNLSIGGVALGRVSCAACKGLFCINAIIRIRREVQWSHTCMIFVIWSETGSAMAIHRWNQMFSIENSFELY